ncbi:TPA: hypothetical protein PGG59_005245 [Raoultella planticola]|nr:hypothetical protein [Raoultella planticola]
MNALSVMGIYLSSEIATERQKAHISNTILCKVAKAIFLVCLVIHLENSPLKSSPACQDWEPEMGHSQSFFSMVATTSFSLICT